VHNADGRGHDESHGEGTVAVLGSNQSP
jgi:hypothetical protein